MHYGIQMRQHNKTTRMTRTKAWLDQIWACYAVNCLLFETIVWLLMTKTANICKERLKNGGFLQNYCIDSPPRRNNLLDLVMQFFLYKYDVLLHFRRLVDVALKRLWLLSWNNRFKCIVWRREQRKYSTNRGPLVSKRV